jgi:hypothetical protein
MTKKVTLLALLVVCAAALVWAGPEAQKSAAGNAKMEAMKAEMMKCAVCKNVAMRMDEIGPMGMEPAKLNDGFAIRHWVISNDPAKIAAFHAACDACSKAGQASMTMTDEQAKTDLCGFCQGIRSAMKAGAHMSQGTTKKGDVMVVTSSDPAVQGQLATLAQQCEMMAASMEAPAVKPSAEKP